MKLIFLFLAYCILSIAYCFAQDDLLKMIEDTVPKRENAIATFKTTRIINAHSNETVKGHTLDFRVTHRFDDIAGGNGGYKPYFFGLYNLTDVRISFDYGITDDLMLAIGKSKFRETWDGFIKYRLLQQTTDNKIPLAITIFSSAVFSGQTVSPDSTSELSYNYNANSSDKILRRFSSCTQIIIVRKFGNVLSLALLPTYVHRNYVEAADDNGMIAVGIGGRLKFSRSCAVIADYFYIAGGDKRTKDFQAVRPGHPGFYNPLAVGLEIETGGHVFHLTFTNSEGIIENAFIPYTMKSWLNGGFRWGFNISRVFNIGKR